MWVSKALVRWDKSPAQRCTGHTLHWNMPSNEQLHFRGEGDAAGGRTSMSIPHVALTSIESWSCLATSPVKDAATIVRGAIGEGHFGHGNREASPTPRTPCWQG